MSATVRPAKGRREPGRQLRRLRKRRRGMLDDYSVFGLSLGRVGSVYVTNRLVEQPKSGSHVPGAPAPHLPTINRGDERAEAVPFRPVGQPGPVGSQPGLASLGEGEPIPGPGFCGYARKKALRLAPSCSQQPIGRAARALHLAARPVTSDEASAAQLAVVRSAAGSGASPLAMSRS